MADLSPATQAIIDAFTEDNSLHDWKHNHWNTEALAAALRAAVAQTQQRQYGDCWICDANELRAIAAELDNTSQPS